MNRRNLLKLAGVPFAALMTKREAAAQEKVAKALRGMPAPKIKDVSVIATAPAGSRLVVVKITTDQDGLYGYGCATFTQRADLVSARRREIPEAVPHGEAGGPHRRYLAGHVQQLLLAQRPGAEQCHQRRGHGAVGHQGPAGGHAGV